MQGALGGSVDIANPDGNLRSIYYARYVDWFFTTPLILLDVILMGNVALGATLWYDPEPSFRCTHSCLSIVAFLPLPPLPRTASIVAFSRQRCLLSPFMVDFLSVMPDSCWS